MAKTLYYNGTIITMSGSEPESAEAVLTENDKILAVGSLEAVSYTHLGRKDLGTGGSGSVPGLYRRA